MISNVYSLHDSKALTYSPPFLAAQHGLAIRMVMEIADGPSTSVGRHPADFTLYCIGRFDDQSGQMLPAEHREHISDVVSLLPVPLSQQGSSRTLPAPTTLQTNPSPQTVR